MLLRVCIRTALGRERDEEAVRTAWNQQPSKQVVGCRTRQWAAVRDLSASPWTPWTRLSWLLESSSADKLPADKKSPVRQPPSPVCTSARALCAHLNKFAVGPAPQGRDAVQNLWCQLVANHKTLIWRLLKEKPFSCAVLRSLGGSLQMSRGE